MSRRRLQNKISQSSITLPLACVAVTLLWWLPQGVYTTSTMMGWIAAAVTTIILILQTHSYNMLRVRSQMPATLLIMLLVCYPPLHDINPGTSAMPMLAAAISFLMSTTTDSSNSRNDRKKTSIQLSTLHAYTLLSLGSLAWPPLLLLAPVILFCQTIYLRTLSWRSFAAACMGLTLPYLFWAAATLLIIQLSYFNFQLSTLNFQLLSSHIAAIAEPITNPITNKHIINLLKSSIINGQWSIINDQWSMINGQWSMVNGQWSIILTFIIALTGIIHYRRNSYDDNIRVRMFYQTYIALQLTIALWMILQPERIDTLLPIFILTTAPTAAHYATHATTWLSNAWFMLLSIALFAATALNLLSPYINLSIVKL